MNATQSLDVSRLPDYAFGNRSLMWWGTMGMMAAEGTIFAGLLAMYFYTWDRTDLWPPAGSPPGLLFATLNTVILLASCWPNHLYKKAAEHENLAATRLWLVVSLVFALAFVVVRGFEFTTLYCRWSDSAYASVLWVLLGFHTTHLITDVLDTLVLTVLMFTGPLKPKRFADVSENGMYWYFVVLAWLPIYITLYLLPRWS